MSDRATPDRPAGTALGVGTVDMGKITQEMERKGRRLDYFFFMLDLCRIPINAIRPIAMPTKNPITAINFVPSH